jgi:hypothetical protein
MNVRPASSPRPEPKRQRTGALQDLADLPNVLGKRAASWAVAAIYCLWGIPQNTLTFPDGFGSETAHWVVETENRNLPRK